MKALAAFAILSLTLSAILGGRLAQRRGEGFL